MSTKPVHTINVWGQLEKWTNHYWQMHGEEWTLPSFTMFSVRTLSDNYHECLIGMFLTYVGHGIYFVCWPLQYHYDKALQCVSQSRTLKLFQSLRLWNAQLVCRTHATNRSCSVPSFWVLCNQIITPCRRWTYCWYYNATLYIHLMFTCRIGRQSCAYIVKI